MKQEDLRNLFHEWAFRNGVSVMRNPTTGAYLGLRATWCWRCLSAIVGVEEY